MSTLTPEQLTHRKDILKTMIEIKRASRPWLNLREAVDEVSIDLLRDKALLGMINALAASTTIIENIKESE
jgi:hypothetical protein